MLQRAINTAQKTIEFVLPVLMPSWRFFKTVEPSPRVQFAVLDDGADPSPSWQAFRPRPQSLSAFALVSRLFWNPAWNEDLYLVSCAERIQGEQNRHAIHEIRQRVGRDLLDSGLANPGHCVQFRLIFVQDRDGQRVEDIVFVSDVFALDEAETL